MEKLKSVLSRHKDDPENTADSTATGQRGGQGSHLSRAGDPESTDSAGYSLGGAQSDYSRGSSYMPENTADSTAIGKRGGQGSHLSRAGDPESTDSAGYSLGGAQSDYSRGSSYIPGTGTSVGNNTMGTTSGSGYTQSAGPADTSAALPDRTAARNTAGPEGAGGSHVGTTAARPNEGTGSSAIGQTSSYGSQPQTGSRHAGVPEGSALTAASRAFSSGGMPGGYPKEDYVNPYKAERIDPRVDIHPRKQEPTTTTQSHAYDPSYGRDAALAAGAGAGAGAGAAGLGSSRTDRSPDTTTTDTAPSTSATTTDPAARSAGYSSPFHDSGLTDSANSTTAPTSAGEVDPETSQQSNQSMFGRVLGAVGLGGAAGATAASVGSHDRDSAVTDQPTTTTGTSSYTAPTQSGPGASHHRKESIPTTAYPAGLNSPSPINPPVGGTSGAPIAEEQQQHYGRDAAIGAGATGTGLLGAFEFEKSREMPESTTGQSTFNAPTTAQSSGLTDQTSSTAPAMTYHDAITTGGSMDTHSHGYDGTGTAAGIGAGAGAGTGALAANEYGNESGRVGQYANEPYMSSTASAAGTGAAGGAPVMSESTYSGASAPISSEREDQRHLGRDAALGGTAGAGLGALGAHEYDEQRAVPTSQMGTQAYGSQPSTGPTTGTSTSAPYTTDNYGTSGAAAMEQIPRQDEHHYGRDAALGAGGVGAGAYGAHEFSKHDAENTEQHGTHGHEHHKLEKSEKQQQKAMEKQEKKHEKELEKEEKRHEKEVAATGVGAAGVGAGTYGAERYPEPHQSTTTSEHPNLAAADAKDMEHHEKEKKPSLFKRIFKSRKNKDTGEDEDYESDEEDLSHHHHGGATAATATGAGAAGVGTHHDQSDQSYGSPGGFVKPSYNPFKKDEPALVAPTDQGPTTAIPTHGAGDDRPHESVTGLPYDPSKDPQTAERLEQRGASGAGPFGEGADSTGVVHHSATEGDIKAMNTAANAIGAGVSTLVEQVDAKYRGDRRAQQMQKPMSGAALKRRNFQKKAVWWTMADL